jgi:hypothetical protein
MRRQMRDATILSDDCLVLWNESDPTHWSVPFAKGWAPGTTYVDPLMSRTDPQEIDALIGAVQTNLPCFRFRIVKRAERVGDHVCFSWEHGPPCGEAPIEGTSFDTCDERLIKSVAGFLGRVPTST